MDIYQKRIERKIKKIVLKVLKESELSKSNVVLVVKEHGFHKYDIYNVLNKLVDKGYVLEYKDILKINKDKLDSNAILLYELIAHGIEVLFYVVGFLVRALFKLLP